MNRVFQVILTMTYGHPVSSFVPGHNLSHHKFTQTRRDVMRTTKVRYRWNFLNGLLFLVHVGNDVMKGDIRYLKAMFHKNPKWARQMMLEWGILYAVYGALVVLDWKKFLFFVFLPHKYAAWGIITMNVLQHDGCDQDSEYNHSRNFVGRLVNWFTYNNGFHTIHHMEPGLHWSLLPAEHAKRVAPFIHPNLDQPSLLAYLWRTFGWPGKRTTYLGEPLVLPEEGPDEEWVPSPKETPADVSFGAMA
jgi:fatty acid desaturase